MLVELSGFTVDSILNDRFQPIYTWGAPPFITCMAILGRPFSPQVRPPEDCEEAMSVASRSFLDTVLSRLQGASRCQIHPNTILVDLSPSDIFRPLELSWRFPKSWNHSLLHWFASCVHMSPMPPGCLWGPGRCADWHGLCHQPKRDATTGRLAGGKSEHRHWRLPEHMQHMNSSGIFSSQRLCGPCKAGWYKGVRFNGSMAGIHAVGKPTIVLKRPQQWSVFFSWTTNITLWLRISYSTKIDNLKICLYIKYIHIGFAHGQS